MKLEEARKELRKAEARLRIARSQSRSGKPVNLGAAARNYEYWLTKVYMAWEKSNQK